MASSWRSFEILSSNSRIVRVHFRTLNSESLIDMSKPWKSSCRIGSSAAPSSASVFSSTRYVPWMLCALVLRLSRVPSIAWILPAFQSGIAYSFSIDFSVGSSGRSSEKTGREPSCLLVSRLNMSSTIVFGSCVLAIRNPPFAVKTRATCV